MRKQIVFYPISIFLYLIGFVLLTEIAMQRISSILETGMVLIPAFINLGIIIYAMYFSRREEKLGIGGTIAYLLFYAVVLISFCISVTVAIMLYMDIIPQIGRFF